MTSHGPEVMMSLVHRRTRDHNFSLTVKNQRNGRQDLKKARDVARPLKNVQFWSKSRKAKISTTGIY